MLTIRSTWMRGALFGSVTLLLATATAARADGAAISTPSGPDGNSAQVATLVNTVGWSIEEILSATTDLSEVVMDVTTDQGTITIGVLPDGRATRSDILSEAAATMTDLMAPADPLTVQTATEKSAHAATIAKASAALDMIQ